MYNTFYITESPLNQLVIQEFYDDCVVELRRNCFSVDFIETTLRSIDVFSKIKRL